MLDRFYSELSKCLFDLYKVEQQKEQKHAAAVEQARQNKSAIDTQNSNAAKRASQIESQNMLIREQVKKRKLEGSLEMMRRGLEMMIPPKPRLLPAPKLPVICSYFARTKTTVCN